MKKLELKNIIKNELKLLQENQLLTEIPYLTLNGAVGHCEGCFTANQSCNISQVTFNFSDGSSQTGYDATCGGSIKPGTGGIIIHQDKNKKL